MQHAEEIKCLKCFSSSPSTMTYCRYCHQRFSYVSATAVEEVEKDKRINRKLIIAGTGLATLVAAYFIFK